MTTGTDSPSYPEILARFQPRTITSEEEALRVQKRIDSLVDQGSLSDDEQAFLSLLGDLIGAWEGERFDLPDISGGEAARVLLAVRGERQVDLVPDVFSTPSVASEVLSGRRSMSFDTVAKLAAHFGVSPAVFFPD